MSTNKVEHIEKKITEKSYDFMNKNPSWKDDFKKAIILSRP